VTVSAIFDEAALYCGIGFPSRVGTEQKMEEYRTRRL
jgi:hypothetical protein